MDNKPILIKPFLKKSRTNHPEVKYDETIFEIVQRLFIIKRETGRDVEVYYKGIHVSTEGYDLSHREFIRLVDHVIDEYISIVVSGNRDRMEPNEEANNNASKKHSSKAYYKSIYTEKDELFTRYEMENFSIRLADKIEDLVLWDDFVIKRGNKEIRYHYEDGNIIETVSHDENGTRIIEKTSDDTCAFLRFIQTSFMEDKMKKEIEGQEFVPMKTFDKTRLAKGETGRDYRDRRETEVTEISNRAIRLWNEIEDHSVKYIELLEEPVLGRLHAIDDVIKEYEKRLKKIDDSDPHDNR